MHIVAFAYIVQNLDIGLTHRSLSHTHTHSHTISHTWSGFQDFVSQSLSWEVVLQTVEKKHFLLWKQNYAVFETLKRV